MPKMPTTTECRGRRLDAAGGTPVEEGTGTVGDAEDSKGKGEAGGGGGGGGEDTTGTAAEGEATTLAPASPPMPTGHPVEEVISLGAGTGVHRGDAGRPPLTPLRHRTGTEPDRTGSTEVHRCREDPPQGMLEAECHRRIRGGRLRLGISVRVWSEAHA